MIGRFLRKKLLTKKQSDLGNVLLKMGAVTEEQLAQAVEIQHRGEQTLLGSIMVGLGFITGDTLGEALHLQKQFRSGQETEAMLKLVENASVRVHLVHDGE